MMKLLKQSGFTPIEILVAVVMVILFVISLSIAIYLFKQVR